MVGDGVLLANLDFSKMAGGWALDCITPLYRFNKPKFKTGQFGPLLKRTILSHHFGASGGYFGFFRRGRR